MSQPSEAEKRIDPRGLIRDAFQIDGISDAECRSVFLDWAIGFPAEGDARAAVAELLKLHRDAQPGHPMIAVLTEGLGQTPPARRRGGRGGRQPNG